MTGLLASNYSFLKALHIIAVIAWMAGMMYLPRLFIYHHQADPGGEAESYLIVMERRLLKGIMNGALIAVWLLAILMIVANPLLLKTPWFHAKLLLVIAISGVHGFYAASQKRFATGERPRTQKFWRVMNEVPFVLLIGIVVLAVTKPF
ncbi:MAG: CopD family protein [Pseudomonadota bacterium]